MTSFVVAILFLLSLFLEPLFGSIPSAATAPALIIVRRLDDVPVKDMDWDTSPKRSRFPHHAVS
jgi:AGZA family xanthine/uracil permease-like MFS transporter